MSFYAGKLTLRFNDRLRDSSYQEPHPGPEYVRSGYAFGMPSHSMNVGENTILVTWEGLFGTFPRSTAARFSGIEFLDERPTWKSAMTSRPK